MARAGLGTVVPNRDNAGIASPSFVWFRAGASRILCRQLDEEGIEWARVTDVQAEAGVWTDVVPALVAARQLAGTGE